MRHPFRKAFAALPGARASFVAVALGVAMASGQAPLQFWWVTLPALAVLTAAVAGEPGAGRRIWLGWLAGAGYFAAALSWIVEPFLVEPEKFGWMAPFALFFMAGGMALFWALAGAVASVGRGAAGRALGFALGLALADLIRGYVFTGFPWALVGHVWVGSPVMQAAALVGAVGLSLLTTLAAALPALGRTGRGRAVGAAAAVALIAPVWVWGSLRLAAPDAPRDPAIRVRLVQPNATQALKWQEGMWRVFIERQMRATAAAQGRPLDLIVWPETAVPWLLGDSAPLFDQMIEASGGVPVALGIQRAEGVLYYNSLAVIDSLGRVAEIYDKTRLTPFGEYMPLGELARAFGIRAFAAQEGFGYAFGTGTRVLDLGPAGKVLPLICYEGIFPAYLNAAPERADWILQITNDGWFGNLAGPYQHLAQLRLRAVEQGLPALRSANTGVSAVIDARGRLLQTLALNTDGFIDADVPPSLPRTPYAAAGDWPATVAIVLGLMALAMSRRRVAG
ncbi:MAG: apolipoprotein N-acyltransferase [Pseudomonadota bacterium]